MTPNRDKRSKHCSKMEQVEIQVMQVREEREATHQILSRFNDEMRRMILMMMMEE